jgi:ribonuclease/clavin/mitogillin
MQTWAEISLRDGKLRPADENWASWSSILVSEGRLKLLAHLKANGVEHLSDRQKIANALGKAQRSAGETAPGCTASTPACSVQGEREKVPSIPAASQTQIQLPEHKEPIRAQLRPVVATHSPQYVGRTLYDERLPDVERLSKRVICVRGLNPSFFTGPGTNTYIVGTGPNRVLIDAGDARHERYLALLARTLEVECGGARLSRVLVTHAHPDHLGGAVDVVSRFGAADGCTVCKAPWEGHDGGVGLSPLREGLTVQVDAECTLRVLHTPGHAPDHLCFLLEEERSLFSGDTILGAGTVIVPVDGGDMQSYIDSLRRLQQLPLKAIHPGHGPSIQEPQRALTEYLRHRLEREEQIVDFLQRSRGGSCSPQQLVSELYRDRHLSLELKQAAAETCWNHLLRLHRSGRVGCCDTTPRFGANCWTAPGPAVPAIPLL